MILHREMNSVENKQMCGFYCMVLPVYRIKIINSPNCNRCGISVGK